jgi:SAM-dependent methyltransferase
MAQALLQLAVPQHRPLFSQGRCGSGSTEDAQMLHFSSDHAAAAPGPHAGTELIRAEWNNAAWGNLQANIEFLSRARLAPPATILEIGCGKGAMLNFLSNQGYDVRGIDIDVEALDFCRREHPQLRVTRASGDAIPCKDATFEVVLSFDLFEHIKDTDRHLAEVRRVLKPGGRYLLQTPNKWTNIPFEMLRQWKKFHTGPLTSYRELLQDHCSLHNYWQLRRRLADNGFDASIVDVPVVNEFFTTKVRNYMGAAGSLLMKIINPDRLPRPLRTNFYVIASLT